MPLLFYLSFLFSSLPRYPTWRNSAHKTLNTKPVLPPSSLTMPEWRTKICERKKCLVTRWSFRVLPSALLLGYYSFCLRRTRTAKSGREKVQVGVGVDIKAPQGARSVLPFCTRVPRDGVVLPCVMIAIKHARPVTVPWGKGLVEESSQVREGNARWYIVTNAGYESKWNLAGKKIGKWSARRNGSRKASSIVISFPSREAA
jgi:hypothetical protein